ncbi:MAG TPA: glycosyltransferase, partial [Prolixibacteraceae bacterium]|nr:glycosyltransferase [Prolixibacteraceae bacterium]
MPETIIITPVKDSIDTTLQTIQSVYSSDVNFEYYVFNDFSQPASKKQLEQAKAKFGFNLVHLDEITTTPSPNYKLVLKMAQSIANKKKLPLILIESDVVVKPNTVANLIKLGQTMQNAALIGAITTDANGNYNFPYNFEKLKSSETIDTSHSLSFCCTLMTPGFLSTFDFEHLSQKKD